MKYLLLLVPLVATAAEPTFQANGIYPGMPVAQAKAAGLNVCSEYDAETIVCRMRQTPSTFLTLPVTNFSAKFYRPYDKVSSVVMQVGILKSTAKECQPSGSGKWRDIVPANCATSASDVLRSQYGPPYFGGIWHKCDLDTLELKGDTITLTRSAEDYKTIRVRECQDAEISRSRNSSARADREAFIKSMK